MTGLQYMASLFGVSPSTMQIGLDSIQVLFLLQAARAERQMTGGPGCFAGDTLVDTTNHGEQAIDQVTVGERVATSVAEPSANGGPAASSTAPTEVDPATWREVTLTMADPATPGDDYDMQLLEPLSWISLNDASVGATVDLDLPELEVSGPAQVEAINACPTIESGSGQVVLGTFEHVSNDVVDVNLVGQSSQLQVTSGHLLWSLDTVGWVPAGDLTPGERLAGASGPVVVASVTTDAQSMPVYNLDVEYDHRYLVTVAGILAHNADQCPYPGRSPASARTVTDAIPHTDPAKILNLGGKGEFPGATDMNTEPGGAIFQDMTTPWNSLSDGSMQGVIGNFMPGFGPKECEFISGEAYRVLEVGGQMRVNSRSTPPSFMVDAMKAAGFKDVFVKGFTVIGTK